MSDYNIIEAAKVLGFTKTSAIREFAKVLGIDDYLKRKSIEIMKTALSEYSTINDLAKFTGHSREYLHDVAGRNRLGTRIDDQIYLNPSETAEFYDILERNNKKSAPDDVVNAAKEP